jgi:hypothetical protein
MDCYFQFDAVWERIMRGEFKLPTKFTASSNKAVKITTQNKVVDNDVYSSPYEIRVRPPSGFVAPPPAVLNDNSNNNNNENPAEVSLSETDVNSSTPERTTIIRLGRSLNFLSNQGTLPVLTEQDAQLLSRAFH